MKKRPLALVSVITSALVCGSEVMLACRAVAQTPGISYSYQVYTNLPTTTFGGGGIFNEYGGNSIQIPPNAFGLTPIGHSDAVTAYDPNANGIFTVSASSAVNALAVYEQQLSVSAQASCYSADAYEGCDNEAIGNIEWADFLFIGGLATGKNVTLRITEVVKGAMKVNCPLCEASGYVNQIYHGTQVSVYPSGPEIAPNESFDTTGVINLRKTYFLKVASGDTVFLSDFLWTDLEGLDQWSASGNVDVALLYVDPVTTGAVISSYSGVDYSTPTSLSPVPSVVMQGQALAESTLINDGFAVGTISSMPSTTAAVGTVTAQVPAAGTNVIPLFPVNLTVSSGPPPATCGADASSLVSVAQSPYRYNASTKLYDQTVTITNTSGINIKKPVNLIVENLSSGVTLSNSAGSSTCAAAGSPYVSTGEGLAAGKSVRVSMKFSAASAQDISWSPEVTVQGAP